MALFSYGERWIPAPNSPYFDKHNLVLFCYDIDKEIHRIWAFRDSKQVVEKT